MQKDYTEFENTSVAFKMIFVKKGTFKRGGESSYHNAKPIKNVKLSDFWIGEYPVTQVLWNYVMEGTVQSDPSDFKGANRPVENVSWQDVQVFLQRLNDLIKDKYNFPIDAIYRLPTEAEWEYAAKGGKYGQKYPFTYAGSNKMEEVGWFAENSHGETKAVRLKTSNLLGLYDMSGNVWEWCNDWYDSYLDSGKNIIINPTGPPTGTRRVLRGGSWDYGPRNCHVTNRNHNITTEGYLNVGFRLAISFSPTQ